MKAIKINYYSENKMAILHSNVEEIPSTHGRKKEFHCKDCGCSWVQTINSPQVLSEDEEKHFEEYYEICTIIPCTETK